jgi:hypothetical protein
MEYVLHQHARYLPLTYELAAKGAVLIPADPQKAKKIRRVLYKWCQLRGFFIRAEYNVDDQLLLVVKVYGHSKKRPKKVKAP